MDYKINFNNYRQSEANHWIRKCRERMRESHAVVAAVVDGVVADTWALHFRYPT